MLLLATGHAGDGGEEERYDGVFHCPSIVNRKVQILGRNKECQVWAGRALSTIRVVMVAASCHHLISPAAIPRIPGALSVLVSPYSIILCVMMC